MRSNKKESHSRSSQGTPSQSPDAQEADNREAQPDALALKARPAQRGAQAGSSISRSGIVPSSRASGKSCGATEKMSRDNPSERDGELVKGGQAGQQRRCHGGVTAQVVLVPVGGGIGTTEKHQTVQECLRLNLTPHRTLDVPPHASPMLVPLALRLDASGLPSEQCALWSERQRPSAQTGHSCVLRPLQSSTRQGLRPRSRSGEGRKPSDQAGPRESS